MHGNSDVLRVLVKWVRRGIQSTTMSQPEGNDPPCGTETVLVVEPDAETRVLAAFMLSRLGYAVLEAHNAAEALAVYETHGGTVNLLWAEALMPRVNGHELARVLAARDGDLRVLFLADENYERLARRVAERKNVLFLVRPFTMRTLAMRVRKALDRSARHSKTSAA